jgi:serine phosphatase RsbU (regulator of sigma subunit)
MGTTTILKHAFHGLEDTLLDTLRTLTEIRTYPAHTVLCRQGELEHTFYIVIEGRVAVTQKLADGEERLLALRGANEFFGELSLLDNTPRMATCTTLVETTVLEVTEEVFDELVERSPAVAYAITRHTTMMLRDTDRTAIEGLLAKNVELQQAYQELQAAQARLVEKERLVREIEIAAEVQRTLLPDVLPAFPDYRFAAHLQPARLVGGDFYDVIELDNDHVGLLIADVADKSIQAALFMAVSRTLFMVESKHSLSPGVVALAVHRAMFEVAPTSEMFVTAFYAVLHRPSGRLTYVRAGQERPLLIRANCPIEPIAGHGRFLGMVEFLQLDEQTLQLQPGDRLLLFSDGVPDATNGQNEQYGYTRLKTYLEQNRSRSPAELVQGIAADVAHWRRDEPLFDDLTLLALEVM